MFLLRFWSLYESCYHSSYVLSQLKTWTDDGVRDLEKMLVQVGVPLSEAKQKYQFMSVYFPHQVEAQNGARTAFL